ncbi:Outer-membrane lipoprotein carrier protein [Carnimonas sp. R-84981]|uniref:outer membrane lipoprotein chaperone LolA n=1 Tax=Carnimonas bestiolae TaxID=3402172 RepID=UPI003EDC67DE
MMHLGRTLTGMFCGAALFASSGVYAQANPAEQLTQLLEPLHTYSGDFKQVVAGDGGQAAQQASGHMWLARPGKFNWQVNAPYSQTVVSNGKKVYLYDPDLNQVSVRNLDPQVTSTPALLLSGSAGQITRDYSVTERGSGNTKVFSLTPRDKGSLFQSLQMTFNGDRLTSLSMEDPSGQQTRVSFSNVEQNGSIDDARFVFNIPKGADVVEQ